MPSPRHDLIILGGGLAGGLAVLALRGARPDLNILLVEPGAIGGNHLWSFFDSDIASRSGAINAHLLRVAEQDQRDLRAEIEALAPPTGR